MKARTRTLWTFAITSIALFMVVLDNLVVSTALPVIRVDLGASIGPKGQWTYLSRSPHLLPMIPARDRNDRPVLNCESRFGRAPS